MASANGTLNSKARRQRARKLAQLAVTNEAIARARHGTDEARRLVDRRERLAKELGMPLGVAAAYSDTTDSSAQGDTAFAKA